MLRRTRSYRGGLLPLLLASAACAVPTSESVPDADADVPRVLVLTAMQLELDPLLAMAQIERTEVINGRTHHVGTLAGADVAMAAFGISMVNATMGAQAALNAFDAEAVVVAGIAGGASPDIRIGDVSVAARWVQYQEHVFTDASRAGWRRGWRSEDLGSYGMMYPQHVWTMSPDDPPDAQQLKLWFDTDPRWLAAAADIVDTVQLGQCTEAGECVEHMPVVRVGGNGASGPTFVDDAAYREWVWETFAPDAFDMETAAIGHVAFTNGVPYIGVRAISDMAGAHPNENRVESFAPIAAANAASVVRALLATMRSGPAAD